MPTLSIGGLNTGAGGVGSAGLGPGLTGYIGGLNTGEGGLGITGTPGINGGGGVTGCSSLSGPDGRGPGLTGPIGLGPGRTGKVPMPPCVIPFLPAIMGVSRIMLCL